MHVVRSMQKLIFMKEQIKVNNPNGNERSMIRGDNYRITVITDRLIRLEYSQENYFEDRATQFAVNRNFCDCEFEMKNENNLVIETKNLKLIYNKEAFSYNGLSIQVRSDLFEYKSKIWHYGDENKTLKGTQRTLDTIDGETKLGEGVLSVDGFTLIDDSNSLVFEQDGWFEAGKKNKTDLYFFGYGLDFRACLKDFFNLSGNTPVIPRFALGNWWSRYYPYSSEEYSKLLDRFFEEEIPLSVAVLDMDWHLVADVDPKYGSGWTGYTWNRKLFPQPEQFLDSLHERNLKTTLNLHPADGIRGFEDAYQEMGKALGVDVDIEEPIEFNIDERNFAEAYFKYLHKPYEDMGVDFWWIDWQQGKKTNLTGIDPLWLLNHLHYMDNSKNGKNGLILSRYGGLGSHRYPLGFSGDTIISWKSLDFQPYFTATASNIGYCWWSHDIGGHMFGYRDEELMVRWLQLGVFSPICRIHSSDGLFNSKEPWTYSLTHKNAMKKSLSLRKALIPYIFTMNVKLNQQGIPLIEPIYYEYPNRNEAYENRNQYFFGSEFMIKPITEPNSKELQMGKTKIWLPEGKWFDFFTGKSYLGNKTIYMHRAIDEVPMLVKAGGIIPLDNSEFKNGVDLPMDFIIHVFPDKNGKFEIIEGEDVFAVTQLCWDFENSKFELTVRDENNILPMNRNWIFRFRNITSEGINCNLNHTIKVETDYLDVLVSTHNKENVVISLDKMLVVVENEKERIFEMLMNCQIEYDLKNKIFAAMQEDKVATLACLRTLAGITDDLYNAICELM